MANPTRIAGVSYAANGGHSFAAPTNLPGDLILAFIHDSGGPATTLTDAGWTLVCSMTLNTKTVAVWQRISVGDTNYSLNMGGSGATMFFETWRNTRGVTVSSTHPVSLDATPFTTLTVVANSITPAHDDAAVYAFFTAFFYSSAWSPPTDGWTTPSGMTLIGSIGYGGYSSLDYQMLSGGGATGNRTATINLPAANAGADYGGIMIAVESPTPPAPPAPSLISPLDRLALSARSGVLFQFTLNGLELSGWSARRRKWNVNTADGSGLPYENWNNTTSAWEGGSPVVNAGVVSSFFSGTKDWDNDDDTYFWSIRATNPGGDGTWSTERIFNPWDWWNGSTWQATETDVANVTGTITVPGASYPSGNFEWAVATKDTADWGPYSQEIPFTVGLASARTVWGGVNI